MFWTYCSKRHKFLYSSNITRSSKFFAPIETKEEALSYAILITGNYPQYEFLVPFHYKKYVHKIKSTYSIEKDNYYEVGLFEYGVCGCGPHIHFSVIVKISKNGEIIETEHKKLYSNPLENGLCID
jgi:hypothetical protein